MCIRISSRCSHAFAKLLHWRVLVRKDEPWQQPETHRPVPVTEQIVQEICEGEVIVIRPHLLSESAQGILLLNLREVEGQEEVLEMKDEEEEESEVDEKGQGSQRECSTHACDMVMTMVWNEMHTQTF